MLLRPANCTLHCVLQPWCACPLLPDCQAHRPHVSQLPCQVIAAMPRQAAEAAAAAAGVDPRRHSPFIAHALVAAAEVSDAATTRNQGTAAQMLHCTTVDAAVARHAAQPLGPQRLHPSQLLAAACKYLLLLPAHTRDASGLKRSCHGTVHALRRRLQMPTGTPAAQSSEQPQA
jgi:hypothetical protein